MNKLILLDNLQYEGNIEIGRYSGKITLIQGKFYNNWAVYGAVWYIISRYSIYRR